ncbi:hypothetical protein GCM10027610_031560 [Dactylosporangium cerinum]
MLGAIARTFVCAWFSEHGWAEVQAVPEPVGAAYSVCMTAAVAGGGRIATPPATRTVAAVLASALNLPGEGLADLKGTRCSFERCG